MAVTETERNQDTTGISNSEYAPLIAKELSLPQKGVKAVLQLLADGNTIPFIARYRKEATGGMDETVLRSIEDRWQLQKTLDARKAFILKTIAQQDRLNAQLQQQIEACQDLTELELLYEPFKPKRRTRATIAREQDLEPLAEILWQQQPLGESKKAVLSRYVDPDKEVPDAQTALQGALDIVAERWSEDATRRRWLIEQAFQYARIHSRVKRGKQEQATQYQQYFEHSEPVGKVPGHRVLAMLRGAAEKMLALSIAFQHDHELNRLKQECVTNRNFEFHQELLQTVEDCFQRLLMPATETSVFQRLRESAEREAIEVFGKNLRDLLMAPPAGLRPTMGIDPGFRTGCKVAVVDATGEFIESATIYPTPPRNDQATAEQTVLKLIRQHQVELISIGNGTASRETESFVRDLIQRHDLSITVTMVSEAGASIYSASEQAAAEFPQLDLTIRSAISIARRLQDPLAELVKTDPKSIGVGQYQHDVNQTELKRCLDRIVESCVNQVGVDLNTASIPLLSYVAGIGPKLAANIVQHRQSIGRFDRREQLNKVPKLGKKAFQQAAGFLRIPSGENPLDASAVHPERYALVEKIARNLKVSLPNLVGSRDICQRIKPADFVSDDCGLLTITDIIEELAKPGRDPRSEFRSVKFNDQIKEMADLKPNLILEGIVTNVTHFGAFVDIGVHQDGLVHISQLSNEYVSDPSLVVSVGQIVKVKVQEVDLDRKRISLTRKF